MVRAVYLHFASLCDVTTWSWYLLVWNEHTKYMREAVNAVCSSHNCVVDPGSSGRCAALHSHSNPLRVPMDHFKIPPGTALWLQPLIFAFTQFSFCFFGLSNTNLDIPLNIHGKRWLQSKAIYSYFPDTVLWNNKKHAKSQQEWAEPAKKKKKPLLWLCVTKHIPRAQEWLGSMPHPGHSKQ